MKKFIIIYYIFLSSFLSLFVSGVMDSQDGFQYLAVARNIYYEHKPTAPIYEYNKEKNIHMSTYIGKDGNTYSPTGLGYSLALVPAVAITDLFYKIYNASPPQHFPLENDWLVLLLASFTNVFFAAGLAVILYIHLRKLKLNHFQALFISFIAIVATNLFAYAKHSFAHMMFAMFFNLSLLMIRFYVETKSKMFMVFFGVSFGIMALIYNQTFLLTTIPILIFYLSLVPVRFSLSSLRRISKDALLFLAGVLPFVLTYFWFESARASGVVDLTSPAFFSSYVNDKVNTFPVSILIEGIYGQLFSPGRSLFIYSPLLLTIIFFWFKLKPIIKPETLTFIALSVIYIFFYAIQFSYGGPTEGYAALWHGESSWGPRYIMILIPLGVLLVGHIYKYLSKVQLYLIFYPLIGLGIYVQLLGVLMPDQIKFHELEGKFYINNTQFTYFTYPDLIPRFSPVFMMSKKLVKLINTFPKTLDHGSYNVRFHDGIDFPFNVGHERWRAIEGRGYISFDDIKQSPVKKISFGLINHPLRDASNSALIQFSLNNNKLLAQPLSLLSQERKQLEIDIKKEYLKDKHNEIIAEVSFANPNEEKASEFVMPTNRHLPPPRYHTQLLGLISFSINNVPVNTESLDFPYVSNLGPTMSKITYSNYGSINKDPWKLWQIHTQVYERTPDLWWIKPFYYWDMPKGFFVVFSVIILSALILSGRMLLKLNSKAKSNL